ncbi:MAG: DUF418 domain-containing protein [Epibacterium sp.]|nr:DUF418 domain-containing protein [Epibacterium sp.]
MLHGTYLFWNMPGPVNVTWLKERMICDYDLSIVRKSLKFSRPYVPEEKNVPEAATPIQASDRIESIDVLRGFALLGILVMNIQSFAMVEAAYFDPSQFGDLTGPNWWVWALSHAFADMKFMALFSMLFGAGIVLVTDAQRAKGLPTFGHHYIRNFWLLVFGLIHAYLIWYGDILVTYAIAAFFLYWVRNLAPIWLFALGTLLLSVPLLINLLLTLAPAEVSREIASDFATTPESIAAELEAYRGSWIEAFEARIPAALEMHLTAIPAFLIWRAGGLMLFGMAMFKLGILAGTRSARFYVLLAVAGLCVGLPLVTLSVTELAKFGFDPMFSQLGMGLAYNYIGSIAMALAYVGIIMRFAKSDYLANLQMRLAAVGRTALTNYILQSLICTFIFYGFGLGLFGYLERWQQVLVVIAIWILQLVAAPLWLSKYRFGPLEWLWRSLTYRKLQQM